MKCKQILIVEDQPAVAAGLKSLVHSLGYDARTASSAGEALFEIGRECPSLLLLDLNLPDSTGGDVLRLLRADRSFDSLPVVVCSVRDRLTADEVRVLGAQDFVAKTEIFERLGEVLARETRQTRSDTRQLSGC